MQHDGRCNWGDDWRGRCCGVDVMSKHTEGPWEIDTYGNLKVGKDYVRFTGLCLSSGQEAYANTRLIAAAPELLEALKYMLAVCPAIDEIGEEARLEARAAIAKAIGETK